MNHQACIMISFGTSHPDALSAIGHLESSLKKQLSGVDCFRAFTSRTIIKKLKEEQGVSIPTPEEMISRLAEQGYDTVICQTLHVIPGFEYEKMVRELSKYRAAFQNFVISKPLLSSETDYIQSVNAVCSCIPILREDEALVLMGHGTEHFANAAYCQLENTFRALGHERIYVGTVEGFPGVEYILSRLNARQVKTAYLMPFMIVAGDHAKNDLAGEGPDSWKSVLEKNGVCAVPISTGLGDLELIGEIFAKHLKEAIEE